MRFLTEVASDPGLEPGALRLGVLKNFQIPIKIGGFRTILFVLCVIFRLKLLISFVFSVNFRFQNNFHTKIIPKTIPIFLAVFSFFVFTQTRFGYHNNEHNECRVCKSFTIF